MTRAGIALLAAVAITAAGGCGGTSPGSESGSESDGPGGTVLVAAAASLTEVIDELATRFEERAPGVDVEVSLGGSSSLAVAIGEGAPVDVFASANEEVMDRLVEDGAIADGEPVIFATNTVVIAVPAGSDDVSSITDFERSELFLGACATQVPCGTYADEMFEQTGVDPSLDTRDGDVRALVTKLIEGELDAAIVYRSDVVAFADDLDEVALPEGVTIDARYPAAVTVEAPNPTAAQDFVGFLAGSDAREVLERAGFGVP